MLNLMSSQTQFCDYRKISCYSLDIQQFIKKYFTPSSQRTQVNILMNYNCVTPINKRGYISCS